jgi:hypothetical protein
VAAFSGPSHKYPQSKTMSYTSKDLSPLVRGDDWTIKLVITSNGTPVNITGYSFWFTLKADIDTADPGNLQVTASSTGSNATSGILYINVSSTLTGNLIPQTYNYDIQQIDTGNKVQTLLIGKVKVVKDITRSTS